MPRQTVPLTFDLLERIDEPCRSCLIWEYDAVTRGRLEPDECSAGKRAWAASVLSEWGACGRVALVDDVVVGHALFAPVAFVRGAGALPTSPASMDAVLLTTVYVDAAHRGGGIGRLLVQGAARDVVERGGPAIEAYGDTRGRAVGCVMPAEFLGSVGFQMHRPHITTPRMRMDLRSTLRWRDGVESAWGRLWGAVRPAVGPGAKPISGPLAQLGDRSVNRSITGSVSGRAAKPGVRPGAKSGATSGERPIDRPIYRARAPQSARLGRAD